MSSLDLLNLSATLNSVIQQTNPQVTWPSTTNAHLQPQLNEEARRRAAGIVAATLGTGNILPTATTGTYIGARLAAATPVPQPADLSGIGQQMPSNMAGLIDALLRRGRRNRGIVFGDTNHAFHSIPELLADPQALTAMRQNGVTHLFVEQPPNSPLFPRSAANRGAGTTSPANGSRADEGFASLIARARQAGLTVVPMDMHGPASTACFNASRALDRAIQVGNAQAVEAALRRRAETLNPMLEERNRVTRQVWVPRIAQVMRAHPNGRFIVLGGDGHIANPTLLTSPDINHEDLDEGLARELDAPVPYVRLQANANTFSPQITRGSRPTGGDRDTPDLVVQVPPITALRIQRGALADRPEQIQRQAFEAHNEYQNAQHAFVESFGRVIPGGLRAVMRNRDDAQILMGVAATSTYIAREAVPIARVRSGLFDEAVRHFEARYQTTGATADRVAAIREARRHIDRMRRALDRLETLYPERLPAPQELRHDLAPQTPAGPPPERLEGADAQGSVFTPGIRLASMPEAGTPPPVLPVVARSPLRLKTGL